MDTLSTGEGSDPLILVDGVPNTILNLLKLNVMKPELRIRKLKRIVEGWGSRSELAVSISFANRKT